MMCIGMGIPIYGGSVIGTFMTAELHWERKTLGLLVATNMAANGLCSPLVAALIARIGARWCLFIGSALLGVASIALATWVNAPWQAVAAFGAMGISSTFAGVIACQTTAAAWFGVRRPFALSMLYAAAGVGGFVVVWLATWAIHVSGYGFRMGCWLFFAFAVAGVLVALLLVRDQPQKEQYTAWEDADIRRYSGQQLPPHAGPNAPDLPLREALRSPVLWTIYYSMFAITCGSAFVIAHAQAHLRDLGHSPVAAAASISIFSVVTVAGNLGMGWMSQRTGPRQAYVGALILFATGLLVLCYASGVMGLYGYAIVFGLGFGAAQVGPMVLMSGYWGVKPFPMLTAFGLLIQTAGGAVCPIAAGAYFDSHGRYQPVIYLIIIMALTAMVLLGVIGPPKHNLGAIQTARA
jgi:MFS family permease